MRQNGRQTLFIIVTLAWLALLSLILGYIAFSGFRLWSAAQNSMVQAAYQLDTLASSSITYTVYIDRMIDVDVAVRREILQRRRVQLAVIGHGHRREVVPAFGHGVEVHDVDHPLLAVVALVADEKRPIARVDDAVAVIQEFF